MEEIIIEDLIMKVSQMKSEIKFGLVFKVKLRITVSITYFIGLIQVEKGITPRVFDYTDPVDGSLSKDQGLMFNYANGSRVIFRKSGTGSSGITLRVYFEKYE